MIKPNYLDRPDLYIAHFRHLMWRPERGAASDLPGPLPFRKRGRAPIILAILFCTLLPLVAVYIAGPLFGPRPQTENHATPVQSAATAGEIEGKSQTSPPDPAAPMDEAAASALIARLQARIDAYATPPATPDIAALPVLTDTRRLQRLIKQRDALVAAWPTEASKQAKADTKSRETAHKLFRAKTLLVSAVAITGIFGLGLLMAQYSLISRHWRALWPRDTRHQSQHKTNQGAILGVAIALIAPMVPLLVWARSGGPSDGTLAVFVLVIIVLWAWLWLYGPRGIKRPMDVTIFLLAGTAFAFVFVLSNLDLPGALDRPLQNEPRILKAIAITLFGALALTVLGLSTFATYTLSRNFPNVVDIAALFHAFPKLDSRPDARTAKAYWAELVDASHFSLRAMVGSDLKESAEKLSALFPPLTTSDRLPAGGIIALIEAIVRPLAVFLIAVLIVISLGFDVLELALQTSNDDLAAAINASSEAYMLLIGAAFTIAMGVLYLPPVARVAVYKPDESDAKKPDPKSDSDKIWTGALIPDRYLLEHGFKVTAQQIDKPTPEDPKVATFSDGDKDAYAAERACAESILARHIGADAKKFSAILEGSVYGAGFHDVFESSLKSRAKLIATLLAPAVTAGILSLLG